MSMKQVWRRMIRSGAIIQRRVWEYPSVIIDCTRAKKVVTSTGFFSFTDSFHHFKVLSGHVFRKNNIGDESILIE